MLVMVIMGWLVTVAGFLLWVRHLRVSREAVVALANKAADMLAEQYDHQPDDARFTNSEQPKKIYVNTPSEPEPIKIPRGWKKADGKTRHVKRGRLSIIMRDGFRDDNAEASAYHSLWHHDELLSDWDIIAYRVCKPKKRVTVKKRGKK